MEQLKIMQTKGDEWKLINCNYESYDVDDEESCKLSSVFKFPPPPRLPVLPPPRNHQNGWQNVSDTETNSDSQSDQLSDSRKHSSPIPIPRNGKHCSNSKSSNLVNSSKSRGYHSDGSPVKNLPPIGVFWDIENCHVPRGKSAVSVAQAIRDKFFGGYREAEFLVVCDVKKETSQVVKELNDAQVNLIHVDATCKNAADEKLRMSMRRFADTHGSSAAIVLISSDVNFAPDLCDLRHRKKIHVILVHLDNCSNSLILCANEHYNYSELAEKLPFRPVTKTSNQSFELIISNLPLNCDPLKVRGRLKRLAENCGGKVGYIIGINGTIKFPTYENALRAKTRMEGENVFGNTITIGNPIPVLDNTNTNTQQSISYFSSPMNPRFNILRRRLEDRRMFGQFQQASPGIPATISQFIGPNPHQAVSNPWQPQPHIPLLGMYATAHHLMPIPHMSQPPHISTIPTLIHTHAATCTSQQSNNFAGHPSTCLSTCRPANSTANITNILSYNNTLSLAPQSSITTNGNRHRILANISNRNPVTSTASQNQIVRGRPILGAHNVIANEQPQAINTPQQQFELKQEFDKKQLQSEGIMQWLNKNTNVSDDPTIKDGSVQVEEIHPVLGITGVPNNDHNSVSNSSIQVEKIHPSLDFTNNLKKVNENKSVVSSSSISCPQVGTTALNNKVFFSNNKHHQIQNECKSSSSSSSTSSKTNKQWQQSYNDNNNSNCNSTASSSCWSQNKTGNRKCRTPSPYTILGTNLSIPSSSSQSGNRHNQSHSDSEKMFNPIGSSSSSGGSGSNNSGVPIELHVTNLDMSQSDIKKKLMKMFQEHVVVLHVSLVWHYGGNLSAIVKVPTQQDAQYAISQLHRRKLGFKRIMIAYNRSVSPHNLHILRSQVVSVLLDVPGHQLPLFKFREMFESRFLNPISASDLNRLNDVCEIIESVNGRMIILNKEHCTSTSPQFLNNKQDNGEQQTAQQTTQAGFLICALHARVYKSNIDKGWAEQETPGLPSVKVALAEFSARIHELINTHNNMLPLTSLCDCYEAEFGTLTLDENGVPLEHLVTCVSGVELQIDESLAKYLRTAPKSTHSSEDKSDDGTRSGTVSPSLAYNIHVLSKELVDLLKAQPHCVLSFNKFIPAYHHQFRRQCRVADYGFTRLIDLLEALPNIVQVMGDCNKRTVTLSHKSQMRRFSTDLLRLLKSQTTVKDRKFINIDELPVMFERHLGKPFDPVDYGLCYLSDLLSQLMENTVLLINESGKTLVSVPKKEQNLKEIERTKIFAKEVVELLSHIPQYSIMFERFIPAYHHHYSHQCRVSDFGFTKLIELFEAIPHVVKIEDIDGERYVTLTHEEKLKVLGEQVTDLLNSAKSPGLLLSELPGAFQHKYGYALKPSAYSCNTINQVIAEISSAVKLVELESGLTIVPVDQTEICNLSLCVWRILLDRPKGKMLWSEFEKKYSKLYKQNCSLDLLKKDLGNFVKINKDKFGEVTIQLTSLQLFAVDVYRLLNSRNGKMSLHSFETAYFHKFKRPIQPSHYNCNDLISLLQSIPHVVTLHSKSPKPLLLLNKLLATAGISLPTGFTKNVSGLSRCDSTEDLENRDSKNNDSSNANQSSVSPSEAFLKGLEVSNSVNALASSSVAEDYVTEPEPLKTPPGWLKRQLDLTGEEEKDIIVNLPKFDTPPKMDPYQFISPYKHLLPATIPSCLVTFPLPPDPSQLPRNFQFNKEKNDNCEGINPIGGEVGVPQREISDSESSCIGSDSGTTTPSKSARRKLRLAAQFRTPLELN